MARRFPHTWPRLYSVIHVVVAMIIVRTVFLLLSVLYSTLNPGNSKELFYPANVLQSVFADNESSLVIDITNGSMNTLKDLIHGVDVAMVMMYAPWCINSQFTARHFTQAAQTFNGNNNILFIGLNCWEVTGSCRQREGHTIFPRIIIYRSHMRERIEYFGSKSKEKLEGYIASVLYPFVYITSVHQLDELIALEESIVVGHFDFSVKPIPPGFISYYLASLQATWTDPQTGLRRVPLFGIISNKDFAVDLSFYPPPSIYSISLSSTVKMQYIGALNSDMIYKWALSLKDTVVKSFVPSGNISSIMSSPVSMLFIKESSPSYKQIVSTYRKAAVILSSLSSSCRSLFHLSPWSCLSPIVTNRLISLPLCRSMPEGRCPIFNPLFPSRYLSSSNTFYCQDDEEMGVVYGGWPPPCHLLSFQFYTVESTQYGALAESVGVVNGLDTPTLIIADFKSRKVTSFTIYNTTTIDSYLAMVESVVKGLAPLIYRSGRGQSNNNNNNSIIELTSASFSVDVLLNRDNVYLVVHYAPWCLACVQVWPQLESLAYQLGNKPVVKLTRINGDMNDFDWCHTPPRYPSIALYPLGRKLAPIWFPHDQEINVQNLMEFITTEGTIEEGDIEHYNKGVDDHDEWAAMGWLLWETAEKEKQLMERSTYKLYNEIKQLQHQVTQMESIHKKPIDMTSLLGHVDVLVDQLLEKGTNKQEHD